jgi:hypothetical protein
VALAPVLAIAKTTARDGLRAPVTGVVLALGVAMTLASPEIAIFTLGNARGFVLDMGAGTVLLATLFLAATTGALTAAERVQDGTALLVLQKSVSPFEYLVGSFLGTASVLAAGGWLLALAIVHASSPGARGSQWIDLAALALALGLGARASRRGDSFQTATLAALSVTGALALLLRIGLGGVSVLAPLGLAAVLLSVLAGCAYLALGVLLAVRLPGPVAAAATLGAAVLGAATSGLAARGETAARAVSFLRLAVPDLAFFSIGDAAYGDDPRVPLAYLGTVALWTSVYALGALALGALLLDRRELG